MIGPCLSAIPSEESVDVIDVFRRPDALPALVSEVLQITPKTWWFQLGVTHPQAEETVLESGLDLVVNRCAMVEHRRLWGG